MIQSKLEGELPNGPVLVSFDTLSVMGDHLKTMLRLLLLLLLLLVHSCHVEGGSEILSRASFPKGFVFGTASSAYQYEGAAAEGGRGPSIWDVFSHIPGKIQDGTNADVAVDQYHRYKKDVGLMVDLGLDAYRFSISWSRIFPKGKGRINKKGISYYNNLIDELLSKAIQPYVTLSHFDVPQALEVSYGSWLSPQIVHDYAVYAETCFEAFGDRVKHWITFNEPHLITDFTYNIGLFPPERCSSDVGNCTAGNSATEAYIAGHHFILSHAAAVNIYKEKFKAKQGGIIGITLDAMWFEPLSNSSKDIAAAERAQEFNLGWMMDPIIFGDYPATLHARVGNRLPKFTKEQSEMLRGSTDFVGINHYTTVYAADADAAANLIPVQKPDFTQQAYYKDTKVLSTGSRNGLQIGRNVNGFFVVPYGMRKLLNYIRLRYNNPTIYITENGLSDTTNSTASLKEVLNDKARINYLQTYLSNLAAAIRDGCDVRGYFVWSLLDNWEWTRGLAVKFGLYHVDYQHNLKRIPKKSAHWYKKLLKKQHPY